MDVDSNFPIDLEGINKIVESADVFVIGFTIFPERLLVDSRYDSDESPLVKVVPPVSSVEERYRHLRELRPRFQLPDKFMFFVWPKPVASFERMGIWQRIIDRALASGHSGVLDRCREAIRELKRREEDSVIAAIKGDGYQNLWTSSD
jgi:hypothetical protein